MIRKRIGEKWVDLTEKRILIDGRVCIGYVVKEGCSEKKNESNGVRHMHLFGEEDEQCD